MGIRISKQICYFLKNKDISKILKPNYSDILDNLDYDNEFKKKVIQDLNENLNIQILKNVFFKYELKQFLDIINSGQSIDNLISILYFNDKIKGICFTTPELCKNNRRDDLIDYYDNEFKPSIKYLNTPIFPLSSYIYLGGPFDDKIKIGAKLDSIHVNSYLQSIFPNFHKLSDNKKNKLKNQSNIFKPEIDFIIYHLAISIGILKDNVSSVDFNKYLSPTIITNWD